VRWWSFDAYTGLGWADWRADFKAQKLEKCREDAIRLDDVRF